MAIAAQGVELCRHLADADNAPLPFETVIVLDDESGITDGVVRCRTCGQHVLIEMLDWGGARYQERVYRTSLVEDDAVALYQRDRARGSCDVRRAGAEVHAFTNLARLTPWLIALDLAAARQIGAVRLPGGTHVPMVSWRESLAGGKPLPVRFRDYFARSTASTPSSPSVRSSTRIE